MGVNGGFDVIRSRTLDILWISWHFLFTSVFHDTCTTPPRLSIESDFLSIARNNHSRHNPGSRVTRTRLRYFYLWHTREGRVSLF